MIDVRSTRGKNARGHKITSLSVHGDKLLVTSNDSRIRMYDLRDMDLTCKFKGAQIEQSQIRASFSPDGKHIICGSEDNYIYIWRSQDFSPSLSVRKDRNPMWERAKVHNSVVTAAVFAPKPQLFLALIEDNQRSLSIAGSSSVVTGNEAMNERVLKRLVLLRRFYLSLHWFLEWTRMSCPIMEPCRYIFQVLPIQQILEEVHRFRLLQLLRKIANSRAILLFLRISQDA